MIETIEIGNVVVDGKNGCRVCALRTKISSLRIRIALRNKKLSGFKLGRPVTNADRIEDVVDLRIKGLSYRNIAEKLGVTRQYVFRSVNSILKKKAITKEEFNLKELQIMLDELKAELSGGNNGNKEHVGIEANVARNN